MHIEENMGEGLPRDEHRRQNSIAFSLLELQFRVVVEDPLMG
jgi:hypothetical protein